MLVASIEARGYRNLQGEVKVFPDPQLTVLYGPNGAGKTNLLDALHFGLTGSSIRPGSVRNVIGFGTETARVEIGFVDPNHVEHTTFASVDRAGEKRTLVDGAKPISAIQVPRVSLFHPDRLQVIKGPPAHRRSLLDQLTGSLYPSQADLRNTYGRTLAQRNAQVRRVKAGEIPVSDLEVWDHRLAHDAAPLVASRAETCAAMKSHFTEAAETLGLEKAQISYKPRTSAEASEIEERLAELRHDDLGRAYVMYGPHLDDLAVKSLGKSVKQFGSQGQQRAAVLGLLLAERSALVSAGRESPILLLDDVMSELDPQRRTALTSSAVAGGQVVVTATEKSQVPSSGPGMSSTAIRIEAGELDVSGDAALGSKAA